MHQEIVAAEKFLAITFNGENLTGKVFSYTYKWSMVILWSGHSVENKASRKFNRRNTLPTKNFRSTVCVNNLNKVMPLSEQLHVYYHPRKFCLVKNVNDFTILGAVVTGFILCASAPQETQYIVKFWL